jgi:hypothetical protein
MRTEETVQVDSLRILWSNLTYGNYMMNFKGDMLINLFDNITDLSNSRATHTHKGVIWHYHFIGRFLITFLSHVSSIAEIIVRARCCALHVHIVVHCTCVLLRIARAAHFAYTAALKLYRSQTLVWCSFVVLLVLNSGVDNDFSCYIVFVLISIADETCDNVITKRWIVFCWL